MYECSIVNCKIYNRSAGLYSIVIRNDKIFSIEKQKGNCLVTTGNEVDACGKTVIPGLIDLHIHGAGGSDMLDNSIEALENISKTLAATGTTGFLATGISRPKIQNSHLRLISDNADRDFGGAQILGIHLEGPFISPSKKGSLSPEGIYPPSQEKLSEILDATGSSLRMMTIAPEIEGSLEIIRTLSNRGIIASFGHSNAEYAETIAGFDAGINHVTHIFSAMQGLNQREPGALTAIFDMQKASVQIISDGHHIHPTVVKMLFNIIGAERSICITDGIIKNSFSVNFQAGKISNSPNRTAGRSDKRQLAGSAMSLLNNAVNFMKFTGCNFITAIDTVTKNPARLLGIDDTTGSIEEGKLADIVILNADHSIHKTFVKGKVRYSE